MAANYSEDPGVALMLAYQEGDEGSFDRLVELYSPRVFALVTRFMGNHAGREDLVQDVFMRLIRARERYQPTACFSTYLYRIAFNLCVNETQRARSREPLSLDADDADSGAMDVADERALQPGDEIDALPPLGHFTHRVDPANARTYTALAAGSGITPILSIVSTILAAEPRSRVSLVYVNRTSRSTMLLDELHDVRDRFLGRLSIAFAFTREEVGGELLSGRPDRERIERWIESGILPADADHAFLCGPIEMTNDARDALIESGMPVEQVHREVFTTKQQGTATLAPQEITEASVTIATGRATLHGRTSTFDLYEGDSVLDAVQRVRPDAPFSCRSGVCSTCQAVIRDGNVEMAVNYGLTDDEVARGYVLTCQSKPTTDQVEVDFDA